VKNGDAKRVLQELNKDGAANRRRYFNGKSEDEYYSMGYVGHVYRAWLEEMDRRDGFERTQIDNRTLGYVTRDVRTFSFRFLSSPSPSVNILTLFFLQACPGIGDDILHAPLPFNSLPDFISSAPPSVPDNAPIDLVFLDFFQTQLLAVLNSVQSTKNFTSSDVGLYSPVLSNQVLGLYAQKAWN
jgi:hypothetical protein